MKIFSTLRRKPHPNISQTFVHELKLNKDTVAHFISVKLLRNEFNKDVIWTEHTIILSGHGLTDCDWYRSIAVDIPFWYLGYRHTNALVLEAYESGEWPNNVAEILQVDVPGVHTSFSVQFQREHVPCSRYTPFLVVWTGSKESCSR